MAQKRDQKINMDANRGIQNTEARFADTADRRLLINRIQRDVTQERFDTESESSNEESYARSENTTSSNVIWGRFQRGKIAQANITHSSKPSSILSIGSFFGTGFLISISIIQIYFAMGSMVGFSMGGIQNHFCENTTIGQVVCGGASLLSGAVNLVTGYDLSGIFSLSMIGWLFWIPILLITLVVFCIYFALFYYKRIPVLGTGKAIIGTAVCLALNLIPFLNLAPWIQLWAGYWLFSSAIVPNTKSVPNL